MNARGTLLDVPGALLHACIDFGEHFERIDVPEVIHPRHVAAH